MKTFLNDFKAFINKGNALDLAVGIVIGTAFNNIVKSLVADIVMPLLSLIGNRNMDAWFFLLRGTQTFNEETGTFIFSEGAVVLHYGNFLMTLLDFLIIAFSIFVTLKLLKKMDKTLNEVKSQLNGQKKE